MFSIFPIPAFNDNYIWALVDNARAQVIVVDPGDAKPVFEFLNQKKVELIAILITHKHHDHTGGVDSLLAAFPNALVFSNPIEQITQSTHFVADNDVLNINQNEFHVIAIPGHTLGHVAYYCKPMLFCGDTLFANGCGRIFEGTPSQMLSSLRKLMTLPDDTQVYCGHEYTLSNIQFALQVEPDNVILRNRFEDAKRLRSLNQPTIPSAMKLEKNTNPFLRCHEHSVIESVSNHFGMKLNSTIDVFSKLREWKNTY